VPFGRYSSSNPWDANLSAAAFSVTVRTTFSGAPSGIRASISRVTVTSAPGSPARCATTSSATRLASRPARVESSTTVPYEQSNILAIRILQLKKELGDYRVEYYLRYYRFHDWGLWAGMIPAMMGFFDKTLAK